METVSMAASTLDLTLCSEKLPAGPRPGEKSRVVEQRRSELTILVVDDEKLVADSIVRILAQSGFSAMAAYHGTEAASLASESCPDVLLTDVLMPDMNGIELAVRVQRECPGTRVVLFSGQAATADLVQQARAAGLQFELLPKPLHPEQLLNKLRRKKP